MRLQRTVLRLPSDLLLRIERVVELTQRVLGPQVSRADVIRALIRKGLEGFERDPDPVVTLGVQHIPRGRQPSSREAMAL